MNTKSSHTEIEGAFFRPLLDHLDEAVVVTDRYLNIVYSNVQATRFLSIVFERDKGKRLIDFLRLENEDGEPMSDEDLKELNNYEPISIRNNESGELFLITIRSVVLKMPQGDDLRAFYFKNFSNTFQSLLKSERKYRQLFETAQEGIILFDNSGQICDVNPAATKIYDLSREKFQKMNVKELFPHKSEQEAELIWEEYVQSGKLTGLYKFKRKGKDFIYIDFKARVNFLPGYHIAVFSDATQRITTENALRLSESQLKAIFNSPSYRLILVDLDFNVITANKNAQEVVLKNSGKELKQGVSLFEYIRNDEQSLSMYKNIAERVKCGEKVIVEIDPHYNKADYWLEVTLSPILDSKNKVSSILINTIDITSRKKAERSLVESEARFRSLVQNASDVIIIVSKDERIEYITASVSKVLGYQENELIEQSFYSLLHPEDRQKIQLPLTQMLQEGVVKNLEIRLLHKEGFYLFLETTFNDQFSNPFIKGIVINARDITERKFQEESLLLLERAIDSSINGIIITDPNQPDNPIIYANKAFEKITGYSYLEIIGKNCRLLQGNDNEQADLKKIRKALKEQQRVKARLKNYRKDGTLFWNDLNIAPVFNRDGMLSNYIGVLNDITERKLAEESLLEISREVASSSEKDFHSTLAQHIGKSLHMDIVMVAEAEGEVLHTKVFYKDGLIRNNISFNTKNSPSGNVISSGRSHFCDDIIAEYPLSQWASEGIRSYFAVPLISSKGTSIGIIAVMKRNAIKNLSLVESVLNIFSVRAAVELEREKYISALRNSESRFRSLAENSPDIIFIVDNLDKKVTYFNRRSILGYTTRFLQNQDTWLELVHPDDITKVKAHWDSFLSGNGGETAAIEYQIKKRNGGYEWISDRHSIIEYSGGMVWKVLLNVTVITERKKAEEALKVSEARLLGLIENTTDLLWSVNDKLRITTFNSVFRKFMKENYGVLPRLGDELSVLFSGSVRVDFIANHNKALNGQRFSVEFVVTTSINELSYEISYNPIYAADGKVSGVSVFGRDITERKIAENNIIRTNFELDSFVYRASHDLRAPLRSVLGLVSLAKTELEQAQRNYYLSLVDKSIGKLDSFISDLTDFSRNSRLEVVAEQINFDTIINETLDHLKFMDKADSIVIEKRIRIEGEFHSDPRRLSIIFQNLISNAIKYQNERSQRSFCEVDVLASPEKAVIRINDNGIGIKKEYLDKIFNMFFRASQNSYGSGLGLYITKQVVEKLKGKIEVKSTFGKGTLFLIELPSTKDQI